MSASDNNNAGQPVEKLEPSARLKHLVQMSHNINVDKNIAIEKYFKSGRELIKSAAEFQANGEIEKAFVLYLRYMSLFLEKLIHHPQYAKADKEEKRLAKEECNHVFDLAEKLKKEIRAKYEAEYDKYKQSGGNAEDSIQKRSVSSQGSAPFEPDVDEIDRKFDFSQGPVESQCKAFDPFNVEELKQSFKDSSH